MRERSSIGSTERIVKDPARAAYLREWRRRRRARGERERQMTRDRNRRYRARHPRTDTGGFGRKPPKQFLRCPVCGRLDTGAGLGNAGEHRLDAATCRGLGRGRGFAWTIVSATAEQRQAVALLVRRALAQLEATEIIFRRDFEVEIAKRVEEAWQAGYAEGVRRTMLARPVVRRQSLETQRRSPAPPVVRQHLVPSAVQRTELGGAERRIVDGDVSR